jgi:deoxycytidylate deaminase
MPVFIQSKVPMRQAGVKYPGDKCPGKKLDVTSQQLNSSLDKHAFSPMLSYPGRYHGFYCFENFWQSGKRFKELGHLDEKTKLRHIKKWKDYEVPHRRDPDAKGLLPVDAVYPDVLPGRTFNYIEARKHIYVPFYAGDMLTTDAASERLEYWKQLHAEGKSIIVVDFDGPKVSSDQEGIIYTRPCLEVTKDLLVEKINDPEFPFGHGYVVAAEILGIRPAQYAAAQYAAAPDQGKLKLPKFTLKPLPKFTLKQLPKFKLKLPPTDCTCCGDTVVSAATSP